jgi:sugar phosphate isomerase/epimerase
MSENLRFGIVQGRLIQSPEGCLQWFPQEHWESEFFIASTLGYDYIELIAETLHNENNPVWTENGIEKILELAERNNLSLHAICNDFIIENKLLGSKSVLEQNRKLISRAKLLGIQKLILPFFEESELTDNNFDDYKAPLIEIANIALENNILVCIETILDGRTLLNFIEYVDHSNVKCVFDTGNRIAFGHDIYSDIVLLADQIRHIHIKDKNDKNENVLLGTGKVDFRKVFESVDAIGYQGPYTFETHRGKNPVNTAIYNKRFTEFFMQETDKDGNP